MSLVLVESTPDPASVGIADALRASGPWKEAPGATFRRWRRADPDAVLVRLEEHHLHAEGLDARLRAGGIMADVILFLSRHVSQTGRPSLAVHPLGNLVQADYGGQAGRLTPVAGAWLTQALRELAHARDEHHFPAAVTFETTHHGPLLSTPASFIELGSTEREWSDPAGHAVIARAVERLIVSPPPSFPIMVGLGGGHYAPRFTEAALTKQVHYAHMIPTHHALAVADVEVVAAEVVRASPGAGGVHYHDGTLPAAKRDAWLAAFEKHGLPRVESRAWPRS